MSNDTYVRYCVVIIMFTDTYVMYYVVIIVFHDTYVMYRVVIIILILAAYCHSNVILFTSICYIM